MKKSELRKIIKEIILQESKASNFAIDWKALRRLSFEEEDVEEIEDIINKIDKRVGDKGTCVLGGGLYANGNQIIKPWTQGNLGPEEAYDKVKKYLEKIYPRVKFVIQYGNMD